ncbi:cyclophilin-like fold protein [Williamsia herbipolensis]|uniref:Cyclophilin-like fold protein n=1 Tax=Williamsia herbipolensis TaxID=1603258 RepID=A0AAU4JZ78_9NOCA|nr:cyclophilin-like fold protein [Williamsia herbipolensis]
MTFATMLGRWGGLWAVGVVLAACSTSNGPAGSDAASASPDPSPVTGSATPSTGTAERLVIDAGGVRLTAVLRDTAVARDVVSQLPVTIEMSDHGGVEKTGRLPRALSTTAEPSGADPDVGDLGYYAPGNDLVLYYGDQSYYDGIVILGRLDGDLSALARTPGTITVTVSR